MRRLRLRPEYMALVASGNKRTTIRAGRQSFEVGPAELVSGRATIPIQVTQVVRKPFGELVDGDAQLDGFPTLRELEQALRRFYPDLRAGDPVSIVHFDAAMAR